jgi:hypothetical protein
MEFFLTEVGRLSGSLGELKKKIMKKVVEG